MALDSGGVGGGTSASSGGSSTKSSSGSKGSGDGKSFGTSMAQASDTGNGGNTVNRSTDDKKNEDHDLPNSVVVSRSAGQARNNYFEAQTRQVRNAVKNAPLTSYDGDFHRQVRTGNYTTYNNHTYSFPGRYNRPGQSTLYGSADPRSIEIEAGRHVDPGETGLEGRTVVRGHLTSDKAIDARNLPGITEHALAEPYGSEGRNRTKTSTYLGEDPYHFTRVLSDEARARGADVIQVPAGDGAVHVNILPENISDPAGQLTYRSHVSIDDSGVKGAVERTSGVVQTMPPGSSPNVHLNPPAGSAAEARVQADHQVHTRTGGFKGSVARQGAYAGLAVSGFNAIRDGELTTSDAVNVAAGTTFGAGAAIADDALTRSMGGSFTAGIKAGGIVDGVVSAGTSVWSNAQAYERGEISAADATADVIVDTGVGVASGLTGAAAGAAIGSVVPVAGTAVGAVIGFGVGLITSYAASETLERTGAADWAREGLGDALEDNREGMLESAWGTISGWFN